MVTANSSVANFFSMLGAATASPKWEEFSAASSSSSPFGSKGFAAFMGRELGKGSSLPKGARCGASKGGLPGFKSNGLRMLKQMDHLPPGQWVAMGGELQVLFHTLQAMKSANTPEELMKALTELLSPQSLETLEEGTLPSQDTSGAPGTDPLWAELASMLEGVAKGGEAQPSPQEQGVDASASEAGSNQGMQGEGSRASPEAIDEALTKLLSKLLSQGESASVGEAKRGSTALTPLEQLLARILDGHSQEQKGDSSAADALAELVQMADVAEEQLGQTHSDAQDIRDAKEALFEHRQAVIKRLALLIGEALAKEGKKGGETAKGFSLLSQGAAKPLSLQELLSLLDQPLARTEEHSDNPLDLAKLLKDTLAKVGVSDPSGEDIEASYPSTQGSTEAAQNTGNPSGGEVSLDEILKEIVGAMGDKAKDASASQNGQGDLVTSKPADEFSKMIQQFLGGGEKGSQKEGGSQLFAKEQNDLFWQKGKHGSDRVSNKALFAHALNTNISKASNNLQGTTPPTQASQVDEVAQRIMDTVKQVELFHAKESHQMNIRMTMDGVHDLDISLTLSGEKEIALNFVADNSQVLHHLNSHVDSLKAALQWHDIKVVSLSFSHPETGSHDYQQAQNGFSFHSFAQGSNDQSQRNGGFSGFFAGNAPGSTATSGSEAAPVPPAWGTDGLNIQA